MLKNSLTKKKSLLIAGGIAGVLVLGGGGVALASGLDDGVSPRPATGPRRRRSPRPAAAR